MWDPRRQSSGCPNHFCATTRNGSRKLSMYGPTSRKARHSRLSSKKMILWCSESFNTGCAEAHSPQVSNSTCSRTRKASTSVSRRTYSRGTLSSTCSRFQTELFFHSLHNALVDKFLDARSSQENKPLTWLIERAYRTTCSSSKLRDLLVDCALHSGLYADMIRSNLKRVDFNHLCEFLLDFSQKAETLNHFLPEDCEPDHQPKDPFHQRHLYYI